MVSESRADCRPLEDAKPKMHGANGWVTESGRFRTSSSDRLQSVSREGARRALPGENGPNRPGDVVRIEARTHVPRPDTSRAADSECKVAQRNAEAASCLRPLHRISDDPAGGFAPVSEEVLSMCLSGPAGP